MVYSRDNGGQKGYARTASISGAGALTAIGSEVLIENTNFHTDRGALTYDPDTDRALYTSFNGAQGDDGYAWVIQASGSAASPTVAVGTGTKWAGTTNVGYTASCYDTENNKMFIAYEDSAAGAVKGIIATINAGTNAVTFAGNANIWSEHSGDQFSVAYDVDAKKITFWYRDDDNSDALTYKTVTPSASSFTVANGAVLHATDCRIGPNSAASGTTGKGVALTVCNKFTSPNTGQMSYASTYYATVNQTNLTSTNYLGVASNSATTNNPVQINVNGSINNSQTSLTVDKDYYTTSAGNIVTRLNGSGVAQATQFVGTALSATALELKTFPASTIVGKASAGITKGKPVIVEADGDFSPVADTSVPTVLGTGASMANVATNQSSLKSAYDYTNNIAYVMYPNSNSSNYPVVAEVIDPSASGASAITYGTPSVINSFSSGNLQNIIFDQASGNLVFTYNGGSNNMYGKTCTMSGSAGSISYSFGSSAIITGYNTYEGDAFYWKEQNRTVVSYNASSGANAALRTAIISGNSVTWTNSDYYNQSATTNTPNMFGVNSTYAIITYREGSTLKSQLMKLTNSSTGDFTFYSSQTVTSGQSASWYQKGGVINNTTGSLKVGLVYVLDNGDLKGRVGSIDESANSITWGSEIDLITFSDAGIRASGETRNGLMNYWYQDNSATQEFIFTAVKNTADGKAVWVAINTKDDTLALNQYFKSLHLIMLQLLVMVEHIMEQLQCITMFLNLNI